MMEETNYLTPEMFDKFINTIPKLPVYHSDYRRLAVMPPKMMQLFFKILYYCALRVSEVIRLEKDDINLERRILRIKRAKTGKNQKTSIPRPLLEALEVSLSQCPSKIFDISRQTAWVYAKKAGKLADLNIFEDQDEKQIEGIWTHLFRKSYSKWMKGEGADRELRMVKLRHKNRDAHDTYDRPDINTLIKWEDEHFE